MAVKPSHMVALGRLGSLEEVWRNLGSFAFLLLLLLFYSELNKIDASLLTRHFLPRVTGSAASSQQLRA